MIRTTLTILLAGLVALCFTVVTGGEAHADFDYNPPGDLVAGSGAGNADSTVHVPDMRFPIQDAPAYPNSQVWGHGGMEGPAPHDECHSNNYSYPWYDNFCETRWRNSSFCPSSGDAHQGQDIRPSTCEDSVHPVVAAEGGTVSSIGSYSVWIQSPSGVRHRYLHMNMNQLSVTEGQTVDKGDQLGLVSDDFGGTATTLHLHYDIYSGGDYVSPYMSLVESYKDLIGDNEPPPEFDVDLDARILGLDDFYPSGSSHGVPDALPGQTFEAEILLTNQSNVALADVQLGIDVDEPFVEVTGYSIYSDHPEYDRETWETNSADPSETSDNPGSLGDTDQLAMHGFSPDETKRVVVELEASEYSIGKIDDVEVRVWLTNADASSDVDADGVFDGHGGGWDDEASASEFASQVRVLAGAHILDRDQWLFESMEHEADLEGWDVCYEGHHDELIHNTSHGALALDVADDSACVAAPGWTDIDADTYDEMVIEVRAHLGEHEKALYWAGEDDLPPEQFPCDEVDRVYGSDRFGSAAAVSEDAFPDGADEVLISTGEVMTTDVIVGAALAGHRDGPMLLTLRDELPSATQDELDRLDPDRVTIIGGEFAVETNIEQTIEDMGIDVERRAGESRYDTAAEVAMELGAPTGTAIAISTAGEDLVDGIYGAALASRLEAPVLLVHSEMTPEQTTDTINELDIDETIVIGGESAVSEDVKNSLPSPTRLAGSNRHETALEVAEFALGAGGEELEHLYVARDDEVVDAYPASAIGDVTLVSNTSSLTPGAESALNSYAESATLVGGTSALSEEVEQQACEAFRVRAGYETNRAVGFDAPGDGEFHHLVLPLGERDGWSGSINFLRLMPQYGLGPDDEGSWQDIGEIFFQDSSSETTSSPHRDYVDGPIVDLHTLEDPQDPTGDDDPSDPSPDAFGDPENVEVKTVCSTPGGGVTFAAVVIALLALVGLRRAVNLGTLGFHPGQ